MNKANLHKLIDRYEENFYILNNSEHDEIFKWRAAKQFRDVWFSKEAAAMPFFRKICAGDKAFFRIDGQQLYFSLKRSY